MTKRYLITDEQCDRHLAELRVARAARAMTRGVKAAALPEPPMPGIVELSDNPSHEELADFMGISPAELEDGLGMRFERLAEMLKTDRRELAVLLSETIKLRPRRRGPAEAPPMQVAVAMLRRHGAAKVRELVDAKINRAKALALYRQRAKVRR
jgi:hypothetical protein